MSLFILIFELNSDKHIVRQNEEIEKANDSNIQLQLSNGKEEKKGKFFTMQCNEMCE